MQLGLKLDYNYRERSSYRELYGPGPVVDTLREDGIRAVETAVWPDMEHTELLGFIRECVEADLRVSLHPYTEGTEYNPAFFANTDDNQARELHIRFFKIATLTAELQQADVMVNIHPAADAGPHSRGSLVRQSVQFFSWAREWCGEHAPRVQPVAELQIAPDMGAPVKRIGDRFEELERVVKWSDVSATWDFGHAVLNHVRFGSPRTPSETLLPRIAHVHCHDVTEEDHRPLQNGKVPWRQFLNRLLGAGFDGTVILEIPPRNFLADGGREAFSRTVRSMKEYLESFGDSSR